MVSFSYLLGRRSSEIRSPKAKRATAIYVSPSGSDSNAGTITAPLLSIQAGVDKAVAGDTIYLRGGTYYPTVSVKFTKSGTESARYTLRSYPGENVIIDGENMPYTPAELGGSIPNNDRGIFHIQPANYWSFIDLELINGPYGIFSRDASNNIYDRLRTHDNYESGVQIQGNASNNLVLNLDTWNNRDPRKNGESADGLAIKEGSGEGNVVRGLRAWNNVDDGVDFFLFGSAITIENSYAWGNGYNRWNFTPFEGDGNGFKLGGGGGPAVNHVVRNLIAFQNAHNGLTDNSQTGLMSLSANTFWKNDAYGIFFKTAVGSTITTSISVGNTAGASSISGMNQSNNSWNSGTWSDSSFVSVDSSVLTGPRLANGSVPASNFLLPTSSSPSPSIGARIWGV